MTAGLHLINSTYICEVIQPLLHIKRYWYINVFPMDLWLKMEVLIKSRVLNFSDDG